MENKQKSPTPSTVGNPYTVMPHQVLYSSVSERAKILYLYIVNLSNGKGYCFASNRYLAELMKVSETTMKRALNELVNEGYVNSVIILKSNGEFDYRALTSPFILHQNTKPLKQSKPKKLKTSPADDMDFLEFWNAYPNKQNQKLAKQVYQTLTPETRLQVTIAADLYNKAVTTSWQKEDHRFIPMAYKWLEAERYTDDPKDWIKYKTTNSKTPEVYIEENKTIKFKQL